MFLKIRLDSSFACSIFKVYIRRDVLPPDSPAWNEEFYPLVRITGVLDRALQI